MNDEKIYKLRTEQYLKLKELFPVINKYLPLKIGVHHELKEYCTISKRQFKLMLTAHFKSKEYLKNLIKYEHRFDLTAKPSGSITDKQKVVASKMLKPAPKPKVSQFGFTLSLKKAA